MNDKTKTLQLKKYNHNYPKTQTFDKCKSGESQYCAWNLSSVEYNGDQQSLFAEDGLYQQLPKYVKASKLGICRKKDDDRIKDIHKQVALKIATISIVQNIKPWNDEDLREIRVRMENLPEILDGRVDDDLPF